MKLRRTAIGILFASVAISFQISCGGFRAQPPATPCRPAVGESLERKLAAGQPAQYCTLDLTEREFLHLVVDQQGVDVELVLSDHRGQERQRFDSPNRTQGPEQILWLAESSGHHQLEFRPLAGSGHYSIRVVAQRPATAQDLSTVRAASHLAAADQAQRHGNRSEALNLYQEFLELWPSPEEAYPVAIAEYQIGRLLCVATPAAAIEPLESALHRLGRPGDRSLQFEILLALSIAYRRLAEPEKTVDLLRRALDLARDLGDLAGQADALNRLANHAGSAGRMGEALELYKESLEIFRGLQDLSSTAIVLNNLGFSYLLYQRFREARAALQEALKINRQLERKDREATVLGHLGWIHYRERDFASSLEYYGAAWALLEDQNQQRRRQAGLLDRMGTTYRALGRLSEARSAYERALSLSRESEIDQAHTHLNLSRLFEAEEDLDQALEHCHQSLGLFQKVKSRFGEAAALFVRAQLSRRLGALSDAREDLEQALKISESLRGLSTNEQLRISFLETRYAYYEELIDLLMELDDVEPLAGWATRAVDVSERVRARSLLDLLAERLVRGSRSSNEKLLETSAETIAVEAIRERLLDDDSAMLIYFLGHQRSFLWRITTRKVDAYRLPPRKQIEALSKQMIDLLGTSHLPSARNQARLYAAALSQQILGPLAGTLDHRRLVIVGDGRLHSIPFAALPRPGEENVPLVARHEMVYLPSASVLEVLRRQANQRPQPAGRLAVVGDPVFGPEDERFVSARAPTPVRRATAADGSYERLHHARSEAEAILEMVPEAQRFSALGFEASRETALSGVLRDYRIVHFATHGVIDPQRPEMSGVVLSLVDEEGRSQPEGFLRLADIYQMNLPVELVVLSACRTALGREIRGEGLVGLTRSLMYAGASRVLVSLWNVSDEATAELMKHFYRAVLIEGQSPAAALASAQSALRAEPRFAAPYYWAGFLLQGEWR